MRRCTVCLLQLVFGLLFVPACAETDQTEKLLLTLTGEIDDPLSITLDGPNGIRATPDTCVLADGTEVSVVFEPGNSAADALVRVRRGTDTGEIRFEDNGRNASHPLACDDEMRRFYFGHQAGGVVYAFDPDALLAGTRQHLWKRMLDPFDADPTDRSTMSFITQVLHRGGYTLVEWMDNRDGRHEFRVEVLDRHGRSLGVVGPADILVAPGSDGPGWAIFQGGGYDRSAYVPQREYRLTVGTSGDDARLAAAVAAAFPEPRVVRSGPVAELQTDVVTEHVIALLTPRRTARRAGPEDPVIDFCPATRPERARYWLGTSYDPLFAQEAVTVLLGFWSELSPEAAEWNPVDLWFRQSIATDPAVAAHLERFDPLDEAWVARYQRLVLDRAGEEIRRLVLTYGTTTTSRTE